MARPLRIEYEGAFYHVTARGNERKKIFYSKADYEKFRCYLKEGEEKYGFVLHSYVLMTNHYHLLIATPEANLGKIMHYINGSYTNYINIKKKRSGHLFQGRYKAIVLDKDSYLLELSRYLHLNPVRAEMVENPEEYPYSSYKSYISKQAEEIVSRDLILSMFGKGGAEAGEKYRSFVESAKGFKNNSPLSKVYGGMILGGEGFIKEMLKKIDAEQWQKKEISHRKALKSASGAEEILDAVSDTFKASRSQINGDNSAAKKTAIYLMKKRTGATNQEIGELFGSISYSAIAKTYQRFSEQIKEDERLREMVERVEEKLSFVKG